MKGVSYQLTKNVIFFEFLIHLIEQCEFHYMRNRIVHYFNFETTLNKQFSSILVDAYIFWVDHFCIYTREFVRLV